MPGDLLIVASGIHAAFRLAYFIYIGMRLQARQSSATHATEDPYQEWLRFKRKASFILNADGLTLVIVVLLSAGTLPVHASIVWTTVVGFVLMCAGVVVKLAAYRVVGSKGYYWYNFFCDDDKRRYVTRGVYKYLDNPMYTLGYLHAFGFALTFRSLWGLVFALFDVMVLWVFHLRFERPHTCLYRAEEMKLYSESRASEALVQEDFTS